MTFSSQGDNPIGCKIYMSTHLVSHLQVRSDGDQQDPTRSLSAKNESDLIPQEYWDDLLERAFKAIKTPDFD